MTTLKSYECLWVEGGIATVVGRKGESEKVKSLTHVQLFATPWTVACPTPLSMGFSKPNTEVGCHFLLQGIFSNPGNEPGSPALQADSLASEPAGKH